MDNSWTSRLRIQCVYFAIGLLVLLFQTMPVKSGIINYAAPDVMLALAAALILRRPDAMTPLLIVLTTFLADLILQRPPALWSLFVLASLLLLKTRSGLLRDAFFTVEWAAAGIAIALCFVAYFFALHLLFLQTQGVGLSLVQLLMTVLFYPIATYFAGKLSMTKTEAAAESAKTGVRL